MPDLSENTKAMANKLGIHFPTQLPLFRGKPKIEHLTDWAESQITPISRKIAHKFVENLQYIAFEDFLQQLQLTIDNFHQKVNDAPYVLLVGEVRLGKLEDGCSDLWIIGLALEHCGLKEPVAILTFGELLAWRRIHPTITNILMLDDAAYSGLQKSNFLRYVTEQENETMANELSFYVGIPFMTHYAKNALSAKGSIFKELFFLDHVYMPSTVDVLDAKEIFYAKQAQISFISKRQTLTYFDHRFADFESCFQQIYDGTMLLSSSETIYRMLFLGYTYEPDRIIFNKNLQLRTDPDEYNALVITLFAPNSFDCSLGYSIPTIIPPYKLHQSKGKQDLAHAIERGRIGDRSHYPANDLEIAAISSKPASQNIRFFHYKKPAWTLEQQTEYDKAVMLGNHHDITCAEQVDQHKNHEQVMHELKTCFPVLKPLKTESRHPYLQCLIDTLVHIYDMIVAGLRILLNMIRAATYSGLYTASPGH